MKRCWLVFASLLIVGVPSSVSAENSAPIPTFHYCGGTKRSPKNDPSENGSWGPVSILPISAALLHTGQVIYMSGYGNTGESRLWTKEQGEVFAPNTTEDIFCGGQAFLPNGDLLVAGGTADYNQQSGAKTTWIYSVQGKKWIRSKDMLHGRWYPTCIEVGDGSILAVSGWKHFSAGAQQPSKGDVVQPSVERFSNDGKNSGGWASVALANRVIPLYPRLHLLPSGNVFFTGAGTDDVRTNGPTGGNIDPATDGPEVLFDPAILKSSDGFKTATWKSLKTGPAHDKDYPHHTYGASILLSRLDSSSRKRLTRVIVIAGGGFVWSPNTMTNGQPGPGGIQFDQKSNPRYSPATNFVDVFDFGSNPTDPDDCVYHRASPMNFARRHHNAVILPTAETLVLGGVEAGRYGRAGAQQDGNDCQNSQDFPQGWVTVPELLDTKSLTSKRAAEMPIGRGYHSAALLLADGRVAMFGTGNPFPNFQQVDIYSPPYCHKKSDAERKSMLRTVPTTIRYNQRFFVGTTPGATKVVLVRSGASTHGLNAQQRLVELRSLREMQSGLIVTAPETPNIAPPGYYMMFSIEKDVPSLGKWVRLIR